jgi:chromosome partitioning protein
LETVREGINPHIRIMGVLATMFDQRTRISNRVLEALKEDERFKGKVFETVIRVNTTIAESAYYSKPVVFFRRSSPGAEDYLALTREILN